MIDDGDVRIVQGDAVERLREMPDGSVHCIVTSPPFLWLRDYGVEGQIGMEETPEAYIDRLVSVFRECRRVLRDDGVMWVEIGDSYAASSTYRAPQSLHTANGWAQEEARVPRPSVEGVKPKDLIGIPWMLAFALRSDGWYLRAENIWSKPNCMPESVNDRTTRAHSQVFMFAKSRAYFYDSDAVRTPHQPDGRKVTAHPGGRENSIQERSKGDRWPGSGANARSVWEITTESTPFAHFATMPQALAEKCIKAGTSEHGCCAECEAPWKRVVERAIDESRPPARQNIVEPEVTKAGEGTNARGSKTWGHYLTSTTKGWEPTCHHNAGVIPCTVLDPFMGSGTTALVARRLGRHAVGIELNESYVEICKKRLQQLSLLG